MITERDRESRRRLGKRKEEREAARESNLSLAFVLVGQRLKSDDDMT